MYKPYALPGAKGGFCYTATFQPVPVEALFSITVYGPENDLMSNVGNIVSANRTVVTNDDGLFVVAFGGCVVRMRAVPIRSNAEAKGHRL